MRRNYLSKTAQEKPAKTLFQPEDVSRDPLRAVSHRGKFLCPTIKHSVGTLPYRKTAFLYPDRVSMRKKGVEGTNFEHAPRQQTKKSKS
jgi:hypothetical protein